MFAWLQLAIHQIAWKKLRTGTEELCLEDNIFLLFKNSFADSTSGSTQIHQDSFRQEIAEHFQNTSTEALFQKEGNKCCSVGPEVATQVSDLQQFMDPQNGRKENIKSSPLTHKNLVVAPDGLDFEFRFNGQFVEEDSYYSWESLYLSHQNSASCAWATWGSLTTGMNQLKMACRCECGYQMCAQPGTARLSIHVLPEVLNLDYSGKVAQINGEFE